jgi:hypothetical protein
VVRARVSPLSGRPEPRDLAFMVNSTYFWFDHEFDQNFVELTICRAVAGCTKEAEAPHQLLSNPPKTGDVATTP